MPEATAQHIESIEDPVVIDVRLEQIRNGVGATADLAVGNKPGTTNPVPPGEQKPEVPSHVPDGTIKTTATSTTGKVGVPGTFNAGAIDQINHYTPQIIDDITGNKDSAPVRTVNAREVTNIQEYRNKRVRDNVNQGKSEPNGIITRITRLGNWFLKENKAA